MPLQTVKQTNKINHNSVCVRAGRGKTSSLHVPWRGAHRPDMHGICMDAMHDEYGSGGLQMIAMYTEPVFICRPSGLLNVILVVCEEYDALLLQSSQMFCRSPLTLLQGILG